MATAMPTAQNRETCAPLEWPAQEAVDDVRRQVRRAVMDMRHATEDAAAEAALKIRRRPLAAVGLAVSVGTFVGAAIGFAAGWFMNGRR